MCEVLVALLNFNTTNMCKIVVLERCIKKNYTQLFKFGFKIYNSGKSRLNLQEKRLKY